MGSVTKPRQYVNRRALQKSNVSGETSKRSGNLPDLDSDATMKVCRVCLSMNVRMYDIWQSKLSDMYEKVTGVEITLVDKLPKMLCCQCVASLSSANNFIKKTQNTHQLLVAKILGDKAFVTIGDVKSIDRAQYQLESLGFKISKENKFSVHIKNKRDTNNTEYYNYYEATGADFCEDTENTDIHHEVPIKSEPLDPSEEQNDDKNNKAADINNGKGEVKIQDLVVVKQEYIEPSDADQSNKPNDISDLKVETKFPELVVVKQEHISEEEQLTNNLFNVGSQHADPSLNDNGVGGLRIKKEPDLLEPVKYMDTVEQEKYTHIKEEVKVCDRDNTSDANSASSDYTFVKKLKKDSKGLFICDVCDKHFSVKTILIQHIKNHSKSTLFRCAKCKYKSYNKRYLTAHVTSMHPSKGVFCCKFCRYKTSIKTSLNRHVKRKHIHSLFNCEYCSHVTHSKMLLHEHINAKHTKQVVYYCRDCSYKTYKKLSLDSHVKVKHSRKIIYNCPKCCFKTYNKGYIKYHVDSQHVKAVSFLCSFCDYSSHVKRNFIRHVQARHSKQVCQE